MNQKIFNRRVYFTGIIILCIACTFIYTVFRLHFSDRIHIRNPYARPYVVRRGTIRDTHHTILAISIESHSLFANPEQITDPEEVASKLAPILHVSEQFILERITREKRFVWLKRKLMDQTVARIKALHLKGLHFKKEFKRMYPHGKLAANLLGFVDVDNKGLEGIEYKFNNELNALAMQEKHLYPVFREKYIYGNTITLTIDKYIQYMSEKALEKAVTKYSAKQGAVVIMEVATGRILALAKYPFFDPARYYDYTPVERRNFAIVDSFEPGSTMKIFAVATWLSKHRNYEEKQFICKGALTIGDATINCTGVHGRVSVADAVQYSCNVGIMKSMKNINPNLFYAMLRKFGFGEKVGIALPGETAGILRDVSTWSGLSKFSISIGQEISVTSLQLAAAYAAIANGGIYYVPSIIDSITRDDGTIIQQFYARSRGRVISQNDSQILRKLLRRVVTGGTGRKAAHYYYTVAGKTGTAQKSKRRGGYFEEKYVASFAAFAPYEKPDVCVLVIVDEPQHVTSGSEVAAPVVAELVDRVLPYRGINQRIVSAPLPSHEKEKIIFNGTHLPDFKGVLLADAVRLLSAINKKYHIRYDIKGSGKVVKQYPEPGTPIQPNTHIVLLLQ